MKKNSNNNKTIVWNYYLLIDLTLPIDSNDAFLEQYRVAKSGHLGTHIDIDPSKEIDPERFLSRGSLVDLKSLSHGNDNTIDLPESTLNKIATSHDDERKRSFILLHTGWLKETYGTKDYFENNPEFSNRAIERLVALRPNMIGIDAPGLARAETHSAVDRKLLEHDILVVENVANVEAIKNNSFQVYCFPMNLKGSSGLPVRILVELDAR